MLKAGVIGCGGRGRAHAQGYQLSPEVEIVACADPIDDSRGAFIDQFEVERGVRRLPGDVGERGPRFCQCLYLDSPAYRNDRRCRK